MAQITFVFDAATLSAIAELQGKFGATSNAQFVRKALALAKIASQNADDKNVLTIITPDNEEKKIKLG